MFGRAIPKVKVKLELGAVPKDPKLALLLFFMLVMVMPTVIVGPAVNQRTIYQGRVVLAGYHAYLGRSVELSRCDKNLSFLSTICDSNSCTQHLF